VEILKAKGFWNVGIVESLKGEKRIRGKGINIGA
jgi:hypothetical protein